MIEQLNSRQSQLDDEISGYDLQLKSSDDAVASANQELDIQKKLLAQKVVGSQRMLQLRVRKQATKATVAAYIRTRISSDT